MEDAGRWRDERPLAEGDDGRQEAGLGVGVEGGVGEEEQDGSREADVGTGEEDRLGVEGEEEGGGKVMEGECLSEAMFLSEPVTSDSLCLFEDGGGGRRGTLGSGLDSGGVGCVSGFEMLVELRSASSSRSRESSCTTTSATSAPFVSSATCAASSHTDPELEGSGDGGTEEKLPSFCSLSSFSSVFLSSSPSSLNAPSSPSSESPKPSCARALAIFLR